jgi:hypothetical protein
MNLAQLAMQGGMGGGFGRRPMGSRRPMGGGGMMDRGMGMGGGMMPSSGGGLEAILAQLKGMGGGNLPKPMEMGGGRDLTHLPSPAGDGGPSGVYSTPGDAVGEAGMGIPDSAPRQAPGMGPKPGSSSAWAPFGGQPMMGNTGMAKPMEMGGGGPMMRAQSGGAMGGGLEAILQQLRGGNMMRSR